MPPSGFKKSSKSMVNFVRKNYQELQEEVADKKYKSFVDGLNAEIKRIDLFSKNCKNDSIDSYCIKLMGYCYKDLAERIKKEANIDIVINRQLKEIEKNLFDLHLTNDGKLILK
ncbi:MAG: hypothetical protein U0469_01690 [Candidatus Paceibacterota bacterium]|jgi:hypothetical protein